MASRFSSLGVKGSLFLGGVGVGAVILATTMTGTTVITSNKVIYSSGGLLPIYQSIALTEVDGSSSGAVSVRNPYDKTLLCQAPTVRITTAAAPTTNVDIWTATGAVGSVTGCGSRLVYDNLTLSVQTTTLTGSSIPGSRFVLAPYSSTTSANRINVFSGRKAGSGQSLVGTMYVPCYALD